ncbi:von Willebrand factor A domain-containing protein 1-like [Liolophura sinensis]|uniref:von Willebrand factor A domain-containing protein 1-like n=1 Tax=Liolophura sinensis TaxID=3198878 RepID=UPI0031596166
MARLLLPLATFLVTAELSSAASFWDNLKLDCGVSVWSDWGPSVNGYRTRTRQIYRQPQNGGALCPNVSETDKDPWVKQTTAEKAATIRNNFLSGSGGSSSGRKRRDTTVRDRDILFIVDSSGSIDANEYSIAKTNLANLIGKICGKIGLGSQSNRAALIIFSSKPQEIFDFDDHDNLADVQAAVRNIPYISGSTCTGDALEYAKTMFTSSKGARRDLDSVKEVVVLTDGGSNCGPDAVTKARELQESKRVFVFAIDNFSPAGRREMDAMASHPPSKHLFYAGSFIDFKNIVMTVLRYPNTCAPLVIN